jgi:hypothetical protein
MRIVARIEKLAGGLYRLDGRTFDSFVTARRAMLESTRRRRTAKRETCVMIAVAGERRAVMSAGSRFIEPEFEHA